MGVAFDAGEEAGGEAIPCVDAVAAIFKGGDEELGVVGGAAGGAFEDRGLGERAAGVAILVPHAEGDAARGRGDIWFILYVSNASSPRGTINFSASNEATIKNRIWSGVILMQFLLILSLVRDTHDPHQKDW